MLVRRRVLQWLLPAVAVSGLASCSQSDQKALYPVQGQVLYQGKPAQNAMVVLHPVDEQAGPERPLGYADAQGNFQLTTYVSNDGAPPGKYGVGIIWLKLMPEGSQEPAPNLLPARYSTPETSGLSVEITASENRLETFQLK